MDERQRRLGRDAAVGGDDERRLAGVATCRVEGHVSVTLAPQPHPWGGNRGYLDVTYCTRCLHVDLTERSSKVTKPIECGAVIFDCAAPMYTTRREHIVGIPMWARRLLDCVQAELGYLPSDLNWLICPFVPTWLVAACERVDVTPTEFTSDFSWSESNSNSGTFIGYPFHIVEEGGIVPPDMLHLRSGVHLLGTMQLTNT